MDEEPSSFPQWPSPFLLTRLSFFYFPLSPISLHFVQEPSVIDLFCGTANVDAYLHLRWRDISNVPRDNASLEHW